jgi:hypothetical protein
MHIHVISSITKIHLTKLQCTISRNNSDNNVGSHGFFKSNAKDIRRLCEIRVIMQYLKLKVEEQLH